MSPTLQSGLYHYGIAFCVLYIVTFVTNFRFYMRYIAVFKKGFIISQILLMLLAVAGLVILLSNYIFIIIG